MKKVILNIVLIISMFLLAGCMEKMTPKEAVRDYLEMYITLDDNVIKQIDDFVDKEDLNTKQKEVYKSILKKQYTTLVYDIKNEKIEDNGIAYVDVKINVIDLYKVQQEALAYFEDKKDEFNDEEGNYDKNKFLDYTLLQMKNAKDMIEYDVTFKVIKDGDDWEVSQLSDDMLEKLHGIYNYEE